MAKKVKITKGGQTVYPATVMDAVVHPDLRVDSSKLIEEVNVSKIYPTGGIDGTNKYTLETAIAKIPSSLRNVGLKCSFINEAGELETWIWQGSNFEDSNCWMLYNVDVRTNIESRIGSFQFLIDLFETGRWIGEGSSISPDSLEGYKRLKVAYDVDTSDTHLIELCNSNYKKVRIADYNLIIKFCDENGDKVNSSYYNEGYGIKVDGNAKYMYIFSKTENINGIIGFFLIGLFSKTAIEYIRESYSSIDGLGAQISTLQKDMSNLSMNVNSVISGLKLNYLPLDTLDVFPYHAYVGSTLGDNPINNSTNHAYDRIDVSTVKDNTLLYLIDGDGVNRRIGTWKFFGADGNQITATQGGTTGVDAGYLKPSGASVLGLHFNQSNVPSDTEDIALWMHSYKLYGIPYFKKSISEQVESISTEVESISTEVESISIHIKSIDTELGVINEKINSSAMTGDDSYKNALKILFIGSSFGVDTINEVGNICASFGKNVILGNAYIGAATLQTFINRNQNETGVTYYKWQYGATKWQILNGHAGVWSDTDSNVTDEGTTPNDSVLLTYILKDEPWDYIILQNGAYQSPYQDQSAFWTKDEEGNITNNIVQNMVDICKKNCLFSNPVFGMNMTWAFSIYHTISTSHGPNGTNDDKWLSYGENQKTRQLGMWRNILTNYKDCIANCPDIKFIIPSGTAVQNARNNSALRQTTIYAGATPAPPSITQAEAITNLESVSSTYPFMDNDTNWKNKTDFTRDSIHADFGITRYIIAATLFQTFISKIYGIDISNCTYRIQQGQGNYREQLCTPVTDENFETIIECVKNAVNNPYEISL